MSIADRFILCIYGQALLIGFEMFRNEFTSVLMYVCLYQFLIFVVGLKFAEIALLAIT